MTELKLRKMVFYGKHGCYSEEKEKPQRFQIDLTIRLDSSKSQTTDAIEDTVDWFLIRNEIKDLVEKRSFNLAERLGYETAKLIKDKKHVDSVSVTVSKLDAWGGGENGFPSATVKLPSD